MTTPAKDELAADIARAAREIDECFDIAHESTELADLLRATGWSKPRTVNSATEVHSLCVGTIVRDAEGDVYELWEEDIHTDRMRPAWMKPGDEFSYYDPTLPATVLFTPGEAG